MFSSSHEFDVVGTVGRHAGSKDGGAEGAEFPRSAL